MFEDELLNKAEARKALGNIGATKLYQLLNSNQLRGVKVGKSLKIRRSEIVRYIASLPAYKTENAAV